MINILIIILILFIIAEIINSHICVKIIKKYELKTAEIYKETSMLLKAKEDFTNLENELLEIKQKYIDETLKNKNIYIEKLNELEKEKIKTINELNELIILKTKMKKIIGDVNDTKKQN